MHVKLGEPLWRAVGRRRLTQEWPAGATVTAADVLARLAAEYPGFAAAYQGEGLGRAAPYRLFVDGAPLAGRGPLSEVRLAEGQTLFILLPAIGG
jgi:hypothetical protein